MMEGIWVQSSAKVGGEKLVDIVLPDVCGSVCLSCVHKINITTGLFCAFLFLLLWRAEFPDLQIPCVCKGVDTFTS